MIGVAEKVTGLPEQIVVGEAAIVTAGIRVKLIFIAGAVDVTERGKAQIALEVIVTLTISPFTNELLEYVSEFIPTILPLSCH